MMDWTDRHCRGLHRLLSRHARLYTEMLTAEAVIHGDRKRLLGFDPMQHPVALQLGGSDAGRLAEAARIGEAMGYDEINLNCGCPSDRVQSGSFGACLMAEPQSVAGLVTAMRRAVGVPVTVKCRIGIDDQDSERDLDSFVGAIAAAGVTTVIVHARKAWLAGLSPKENREIPPLDYDRVHRLKRAWPELTIIINGGIATLDAALAHLEQVDGAMMGRAAYQTPYVLTEVDRRLFGASEPARTRGEVMAAFGDYVARNLALGVRLHDMTRHVLGLYHGEPGARMFRRVLSEKGVRSGAGLDVLREAMAAIADRQPTRQEAAE